MPMSTGGNLSSGPPLRACVKFHTSQHYQRDAFEAGLQLVGFEVVQSPLPAPLPGDLLVLWNRHSRDEQVARSYEKVGASVLIAENAWLGPEDKDKHHFAICRNHHNGGGTWHIGDEARPLYWHIKPWRTTGTHILILPQRGMGEAGVAQPRGWENSIEARLKHMTDRPIKFRKHPGIRPHPPRYAEEGLEDCWAAVIWASGAGIKAICAGIPVFYEFRNWIGAPAAKWGFSDLENPYLGERETMLRNLSWAQWTAEEIATGEPFRHLL
jgi:hypothetical protein